MKGNQNSILLYGRNEDLLATRQWVLQSRGYRLLTVTELAAFDTIPQTPPIQLLLLCHSLSEEECAAATVMAEARWPEIKSLSLDHEDSRRPSGLLGQLMHTMDGPAKLVAMVDRLIGHSSQVPATRL